MISAEILRWLEHHCILSISFPVEVKEYESIGTWFAVIANGQNPKLQFSLNTLKSKYSILKQQISISNHCIVVNHPI